MNGIAAYGANLIPVAGTFLNFVSYAAPALRLSALSQLRVIWITTHDSVRFHHLPQKEAFLITEADRPRRRRPYAPAD